MNIEEIYAYCMSLPRAQETFPFDQTTLVFKVGGKMFALLSLERPDIIMVKCDPERAIDLRERYADINPAWHLNKKHWNQMDFTGHLPQRLIEELILHSYQLVVEKLPRKTREALNL